MQMDFIQKIYEAESKVNAIEIKRIKNTIQRVLDYYNSTLENEELKEMIEKRKQLLKRELDDIKEYYSIIEEIEGLQIQNSVSKQLVHNPQIVNQIYNKFIGKDFKILDRPFYTANMNTASETFIKQIIDELRKLNEDVQLEDLQYILQKFGKMSEEDLRKYYIQLLNNSWKFLKRYGFIEYYIGKNNNNMSRINAQGLEIEDKQIVYDEFSEKNMAKMTTEELILLNTYYQNRLAKEKKNVYDALFYIEQLNLWDNENTIEEENLKNIVIKKNLIDRMNSKLKGRADIPNHVKNINRYAGDYKEYFAKKFPQSENDLEDDCFKTAYFNLHSRKIYDVKLDLTYKIFEMLKNKTKINWGYIPQKGEDKFILLGIDYPGYNMPMTIHMKKQTLTTFLTGMQQNTIPVYLGNEDLIIEGEIFPTNILYKLPENKKEYVNSIAKKLKKDGKAHEYPNFIHHINAIAKGIMPYNHKEKRQYVNINKLEDQEPGGRE